MCLIVFAWRPGHALPLIVAANRDEFYARPAQALAAWEDAPGVHAGRDLEAGGTWLGVGPQGRFAALTNIRDPRQAQGPRSRGELVAGIYGVSWGLRLTWTRWPAVAGSIRGSTCWWVMGASWVTCMAQTWRRACWKPGCTGCPMPGWIPHGRNW